MARKNANKQTVASVTLERSRLNQARTLAIRRQDYTELAAVDAQLAVLGPANTAGHDDTAQDILSRVNERNRKANMEQVRKAELAEAERKRRERKIAIMKAKSRSVSFSFCPLLSLCERGRNDR